MTDNELLVILRLWNGHFQKVIPAHWVRGYSTYSTRRQRFLKSCFTLRCRFSKYILIYLLNNYSYHRQKSRWVAKHPDSEWRTSIRGSVSCPVVRPAEPGCLSEQSSFASRCSVQGAAPLAMLRIYPCTTMKGSRLFISRLPLMVFYYLFTFCWTTLRGWDIIIWTFCKVSGV